MTLPIALSADNTDVHVPAQITCAVTDALTGDYALLSCEDYYVIRDLQESLPKTKTLCNTTRPLQDPTLTAEENLVRIAEISIIHPQDEPVPTQLGSLLQSGSNPETVEQFKTLQKNCDSLKQCWDAVTAENSQFHVVNDMLFRYGEVNGLQVKQLVVPASKTHEVLATAHDGAFGIMAGHYSYKKTL